MRLQDILQINGPESPPIVVRKLEDNADHRPLLKEIQKFGETHIIIDCEITKIVELFRQANEVKMMEEYQVRGDVKHPFTKLPIFFLSIRITFSLPSILMCSTLLN